MQLILQRMQLIQRKILKVKMNNKNYVLTLAYDGTRYRGWQKQGNTDNTIQEKLETLLSRLFSEKIEIHGAGRTDAGVHAAAQVANFTAQGKFPCEKLLVETNKYLPEDIAVLSVKEGAERFHSRLNATGKHYRYRILNSCIPDVFNGRYQYRIEEKLDISAMKEAAAHLIGQHDFKSFCGNKHMKKSTVRRIDDILFEINGNEIVIDYYGNGFLQYMIRIMTGTLIEVGLNKRSPQSISDILEAKNRAAAGGMAPAQGLCLMEVFY